MVGIHGVFSKPHSYSQELDDVQAMIAPVVMAPLGQDISDEASEVLLFEKKTRSPGNTWSAWKEIQRN
jgi:hypothetical protein